MPKPRFKTRRIVNDKAKIQDNEGCQHQGQDSEQGGVPMSKSRFRAWRIVNDKAKIRDKEGGQ